MAKTVVERYRRGLLGKVMLILFWGFNLLMGWSLFEMLGRANLGSDAAAAGLTFAVLLWLVIWAAGGVVLGLLVHFTRGEKEIIEVGEAAAPETQRAFGASAAAGAPPPLPRGPRKSPQQSKRMSMATVRDAVVIILAIIGALTLFGMLVERLSG